ncbi:MAG: formylmethanofuran dehydrogenase subunit E family protein [Desulfosporosinus sp.]|nr:formylmethanofuran dehydrogenase subunit E family protein [Desulfosporosinus sp.]
MCVEKTAWEQVVDFHGHTCPEISLGYRVAQIAMRELGISPAPNSELLVTAYTHSCALDAFQVLNRATYGRGTLLVNEKKQHVYHFQYTGTSEGVQISLRSEILDHLVGVHDYENRREQQNKYLETIQFFLKIEEALFCIIEKI